jgi:hypothetical protein
MPKAPRKTISAAPFPFVRQFTAPPFSVGLEDARLRGQLLLDAVKHSGAKEKPAPVRRKAAGKGKRKAAPAKKRGVAGKRPA